MKKMKCHTTAVVSRLGTLALAFSAFLLGVVNPSPVRAQSSYAWNSVEIGGVGAMVTGLILHPKQQGLAFIRTDVGGCYKWDSVNSQWIPLNDSFTFDVSKSGDYYACESLAVDPNNVNILYYAGGLSSYTRNGSFFKSTDQGANWQLTGTATSLYMSGNGDRRWGGERLVVCPSNSSVILFGSRKNGLWRSSDGGGTWAQMASIPTVTDGYGVQSVIFDPLIIGKAYAAVNTLGVYVSNDSGLTWTLIGGSANPRRLSVGPDSALWYATGTNVAKCVGTTWTNYSVGGAAEYNAVAVNPANASDIIVEKGGMTSGAYSIWRTLSGGTSWTQQTRTLTSTATWAAAGITRFSPPNMAFDPFNTTTIWGGQWRANNVSATILTGTVAWVQLEQGHEEDVAGTMIAPPNGSELLVGVFDDDGFAMNNGVDSYPTKQLGVAGSWQGHTWGMAYQETNPQNMLRIGGQKFYGGAVGSGVLVTTSTNGGLTWNSKSTFPAHLFPLACAVSATNPNALVVICDSKYSTDTTGNNWVAATGTNPWRYSTDGGTTWNTSTGLPDPSAYPGPWGQKQFLAADHVNGSKFYYLDVSSTTSYSSGKVFRSVNSGAAWVQTNTSSLLPSGMRSYSLKSQPGVEGGVWVSMDTWPSSGRSPSTEGLWHSTDSGVTFTKLANVNRAFSFGFGAPQTPGGTAALYVYGRVNNATVDSIYQSLDLGANWTNIQESNNYLSDGPYLLEGSRQTFGRVFVGTGGRGFYYGENAGITGSVGAQPSSINLTAEGVSDWADWGMNNATNKKATGGTQISAYSYIGTGAVWWNGAEPTSFIWTDGSPTVSATSNYVKSIHTVGSGFQFTVPATTARKTIRFYVKGIQSQGRLVAHLSDNSSADLVDSSQSSTTGAYYAVYTISYQAGSTGQTLTLSWTSAVDYTGANTCSVGIQACSLY